METSETKTENVEETAVIEYKEVEEPCVALTIIGENRLSNVEIFVKRGFKFSFKAFFSTFVLTIINMFIYKVVLFQSIKLSFFIIIYVSVSK